MLFPLLETASIAELYVGVSVEAVTVRWRVHEAAETREVGHALNVVFPAEYSAS